MEKVIFGVAVIVGFASSVILHEDQKLNGLEAIILFTAFLGLGRTTADTIKYGVITVEDSLSVVGFIAIVGVLTKIIWALWKTFTDSREGT